MASNTEKHQDKYDDGKPHRSTSSNKNIRDEEIGEESNMHFIPNRELESIFNDAIFGITTFRSEKGLSTSSKFNTGLAKLLVRDMENKSIDILTIDKNKFDLFIGQVKYMSDANLDYSNLLSVIHDIFQHHSDNIVNESLDYPYELADKCSDELTAHVFNLIYEYGNCDPIISALVLRHKQFSTLFLLDIINHYINTLGALVSSDDGIAISKTLRGKIKTSGDYMKENILGHDCCAMHNSANESLCYSLKHEFNQHVMYSIQHYIGGKVDDWSPLYEFTLNGNEHVHSCASNRNVRCNVKNGVKDPNSLWSITQFEPAISLLIENFVIFIRHNISENNRHSNVRIASSKITFGAPSNANCSSID